MEEDERKQKLRAGKEKLAQFQKRKHKKKPPSTSGQSTKSEDPENAHYQQDMYDSDHRSQVSYTSEEDGSTTEEEGVMGDGRMTARLQHQLQAACQRVEELEESLISKQLALDNVVRDNERLRQSVVQEKDESTSSTQNTPSLDANLASSIVVTAAPPQNIVDTCTNHVTEDTHPDEGSISQTDVQELIGTVHWLQLQLRQTNGMLCTQNERQTAAMLALKEAKHEISDLQGCILQKDQLISSLAEKLTAISTDYTALKDTVKQSVSRNVDEEKQEDLRSELSVVLEEIELVKEQKHALLLEKENLQEELNVFANGQENLKEKNATLTKALEILKAEHEKGVDQVQTLLVEIDKIKCQYDEMKKDKEATEELLASERSGKDALCCELSQLKKYIEDEDFQKKSSSEELAKLKSEIEMLNVENQTLLTGKSQLELELHKLQEDSAMFQSQIAEYEDKISQSGDFMEENHSLRVQNDELYNKINSQKNLLASHRGEIEVLTCENVQIQEHVKELELTATQTSEEKTALSAEKDRMLVEIDGLKNQLASANKDLEQYKNSFISLNEEVLKLRQLTDKNDPIFDIPLAKELEVPVDEHIVKESFHGNTSSHNFSKEHVSKESVSEDKSEIVEKLVKEIEELKSHLFKLQSADIVSNVINSATEVEKLSGSENSKTDDTNELSNYFLQADQESEFSEGKKLASAVNDTAYQSLLCEPAMSGDDTEVSQLRQKVVELQLQVDAVSDSLHLVTAENHSLRQELEHALTAGKENIDTLFHTVPDQPTGEHICQECAKSFTHGTSDKSDKDVRESQQCNNIEADEMITSDICVAQESVTMHAAGASVIDTHAESDTGLAAPAEIEKLSAQYETQLQNLRSELDRNQRPGSPDSNYGDKPGRQGERDSSGTGGDRNGSQKGADSPKGSEHVGEEKMDDEECEKKERMEKDGEGDGNNEHHNDRSDRDEGTGVAGRSIGSWVNFEKVREELERMLPGEQREKLDSLVSSLDTVHQQQIDNMHRQHVDEVEQQVKAMRSTLEEIYYNQLDIVRSELTSAHQGELAALQAELEAGHQEALARLEGECNQRLADLKQDYDREIVDTRLEDSLAHEDTSSLVTKLNQRLTEEHKKIIQRIEEELGRETSQLPRIHHATTDSQTDTDEDAQGVKVSVPVTEAESSATQERQGVLGHVEDVKKSLEAQLAEIAEVRAQMLSEHEQLMSARAQMMISQNDEVERLQQELARLQELQQQAAAGSEVAGSSGVAESHSRELEEMKQYYEAKVAEMEESYTTDIEKLKQEHAQLIAKLQAETSPSSSPSGSPKRSLQTSEDKQREYVRKTTMLTALSDDDESTPPPSPSDSHTLQGRIQQLEAKLAEREQVVNELKKRLEAETTSAEDLHGRLCDYEENLRSKVEEAEELRKQLVGKEERISVLESEKAALEESGEKGTSDENGDVSELEQLKARVKALEKELTSSKEKNRLIQEELNEMDAQHGEAVMKLKEELEASFKIQLQEELEQLESELNEKYLEELSEKAEQLETFKTIENDLKEKLSELQEKHEKELSELSEKYKHLDTKANISEKDEEEEHVVAETMEAYQASPTHSVDRDSLEASIRQHVREEILEEYETSIDKLKSEYEERIAELNNRLESFESKEAEKPQEDSETVSSDTERETMRTELAQEYKIKLEKVTYEYETKLKHLQDIVDKSKGSGRAALPRSRSLDLMSSDRESRASPEPHGFVGTIKREYEDKIKSLQTELAQYQTKLSSSGSHSPMFPMSPEHTVAGPFDSPTHTTTEDQIESARSEDIQKPLYGEIANDFEEKMDKMKKDYEKQIDELKEKISNLESDSEVDNRTREEIIQECEAIREEYEEKMRVANEEIEKAKKEKTFAEQKVKADMFVWHEEVTSQLKRKHEQTISQQRKEYEEKMELIREELQEEFEAEREKMSIQHKKDILELEDRYDNLVEGLRSGEAPEVAELVQEKFDMELEMAKTLIQQECDETIEAEQVRISEQYEKQLKTLRNQKEQELQEQKSAHQRELADLRDILAAEHGARMEETVTQHEETVKQLKQQVSELTAAVATASADTTEGTTEAKEETVKQATSPSASKAFVKQKSVFKAQSQDSKQSFESEIEEQISEKVISDSFSDPSDKFEDDDDDDDDSDEGSVDGGESKGDGGSASDGEGSTSGDKEEHHDQGQSGATKGSQGTKPAAGEDTVDSGDKDREHKSEADMVESLKQKLAENIAEYEVRIAQMRLQHEEEVRQLQEQLDEVNQEVEALSQAAGSTPAPDSSDATEDLETAHQQELCDLESRLDTKHRHELENIEARHQARLAEIEDKYKSQLDEVQQELTMARQALEQYPDTITPEQIVPTFRSSSSTGSSHGMTSDFMDGSPDESVAEPQLVPESRSQVQSPPTSVTMETQETQGFEVKSASEDTSTQETLLGTLEDVGVRSLDTSMDQLRGTLRGVDDTQDTLIQFSEEEEEEEEVSRRSDRSTPPALLQTLGYGASGPTVKSLDDTTDDSFRVSDREDMAARIKELEGEVEELRRRLEGQLSLQDDQLERLDREKQEESNLIAMLRGDIERLNTDRESLQGTNEHLLGLLSDTVKTYMSVEESIHAKLKVLMEKSGDLLGSEVKVSPGERRRTPPPGAKKSPAVSPGRLSPARAEDGDNPQETSILSNVTDEGLDLTQRISDSIFQGPELATEEEDLLTDSGSRLRSSVTRLLDMIEETTTQLLETRQSQSALLGAMESQGEESEHHSSRVIDLEERIREEVERKDFLALELHKAEGLIEGYASERDQMDQRIQELEEQKETLVLELETLRNKLHDLSTMKEENEQLKREMNEQRDLITENVGEEAQALMLEVSRLNSENREKDSQLKQVHERFEARVRELETSGEDTEHHFTKLLDERKQEVMDLKLQVDALEKQLRSKKQFIEEQSAEREQEREDYQSELDHWRKMVQDLEKQSATDTRMHKEIDELSDQLQQRTDQHSEALLEGERLHREMRDRDLTITEHKALIQQLEQEIQDRNTQLDADRKKISKLEEELSQRPYPDDDGADSLTSGSLDTKKSSSLELDRAAAEEKNARLVAQLTVEEELRQAAQKSKEELVREKHVLQTQLNEYLVQISALRNQLDEMRHRKDFTDTPEAIRRLEMEREKSEEKDKQISDLKLQVEQLEEKVDNRDQQIAQLRSSGHRAPSQETPEYDSDREVEKQMEKLREENVKLKTDLARTPAAVADMSGLSQHLIEEKNQEIDQLSEQLQRLQAEFSELRGERGVEKMYLELESLRDELQEKDRELQSVHVSQAFTDHSLTPDSSLMNVGASFTEKASIAQEMEESEARQREQLTSLETELSTLKVTLQQKEEEIITLQTRLEEKGDGEEDVGVLQSMIHEKEELIIQLTVQVDSLQAEVDNLSDFQNKLQEDFDTVQTMLEEKDREIETLTRELTDRPADTSPEEHQLVIKHEVEIAMLKKELREKDNVVDEKMEELAEITDKLEILETHIKKYQEQEKLYDNQIAEQERQIVHLKKQLNEDTGFVIQEQKEEIDRLKETVQKLLGRPPPPPSDQTDGEEEESVEAQVKALGKPPAPPVDDEADNSDVVIRLKTEIEKLKQQIMDGNFSEDDKFVLIRDLRLQNETLKRQIDAALKIRPPSPPKDEDEEKAIELIEVQKQEIYELKKQLTGRKPLSEDEKTALIKKQEEEIMSLRWQVEAALQISPPPLPLSEEEKDRLIENRQSEVDQLKEELDKITEAVGAGTDGTLLKQKVEEVVQLKSELNIVRRRLSESSEESVLEKTIQLKEREEQLKETTRRMEKLEEELMSAKEVRSYENEMELREKEDEIEELQAELESYRKKGEGSFNQSIDREGSVNEVGNLESKDLVRSMSFYKEQYEEKCSEARQLQVALDLVKDQLQKARSDRLEDNQEEIELFKAELERTKGRELEQLKVEKVKVDDELKTAKAILAQSPDERVAALERELEKAKEETARERLDSVQAIKNLEELRERHKKERRGSLQHVHELEADLDKTAVSEKQLNLQVKHLTEELIQIKRQYGIEDKPSASGRSSESRLQSQGSFELSNDVETLQQQVLQFKQAADKTKEILSEKQKYQTQVVKLEIEQEHFQKEMKQVKKEKSQMEEQLRQYRTNSDKDIGTQLHATQEKLEKTTEQLIETSERLQETEQKLSKVSEEMRETQQDLWKTSSQLSLTSGRLQETEEKLKLTRGQVTEREDQIHQLQSELQHVQHEAEQSSQMAESEAVRQLRKKLTNTQAELEEVQMSLKEAVEMSERQLQLGETKDREFVKLKLDIQQTVSNKDKTIKEQKKELKELESEIAKLKQDSKQSIDARDQQISELREELSHCTSQSDNQNAVTVATLKAQLQNQEEVIETLQSDLQRSRSLVMVKDQEIAEVIRRQEHHSEESESQTIQTLNSQIAELQREVEQLRLASVSERSGPQPWSPQRSQQDFSREESPFDQNGRFSNKEQIHEAHKQARLQSQRHAVDQPDQRAETGPGEQRSPDQRMNGSPFLDQTQNRDPSMEEDSGHQSWGTSPLVDTARKTLSPRQPLEEVLSNGEGSYKSEDPLRESPKENANGSPHRSDEYRSPVRTRSPANSLRGEDERRESSDSTSQIRQESPGSKARTSTSRQQAYAEDDRYVSENGQLFDRDGNIRPKYQHSSEGQGHPAEGQISRTDMGERYIQGQAAELVYSHSPAVVRIGDQHSVSRTRSDEETSSPRSSHSAEGQQIQSHTASNVSIFRSPQSRDIPIEQIPRPERSHEEVYEGELSLSNQSKEAGSHRNDSHGDMPMPDGLSTEAERCIHQLRKELLITKTALMQLQRGAPLDQEYSPDGADADQLEQEVLSNEICPQQQLPLRYITAQYREPSDVREEEMHQYEAVPDEAEMSRLQRRVAHLEEELELYRSSSDLSAHDFVQKVMTLKDELASEHQRHVQELTTRANQDTETQLATMRIKYTDEIEHIKRTHTRDLEVKLRDQQQKLERKHKGETNRLVLRHQEEVEALKTRGGVPLDDVCGDQSGRRSGVGQEGARLTNGHGEGHQPMSRKLQNLLERLNREGVEVLTISELEFLSRSQSQTDLPQSSDVQSLKAGWENERTALQSNIQSLKDLLAQTHKLQGMDKAMEGSDWRAELLRAIGYVFAKERDTLLAELRSHVLSYPNTNSDEIQRLEQKIRTQEAHHHASLDQIFGADRQSMLAEIRDLRAHATIARMHNQEERDRQSEKLASTEDQALKKERQLKKQVQLLEFKIQQEKLLQEDLRVSLEDERNRAGDLSSQLNQEKVSNLDLQASQTSLQVQASKLKESLEREQSRYISVTTALEEEKTKSLNLSELLETERQTLWRVQAELESLKQQGINPQAIQELDTELSSERQIRHQLESQHQVDMVTVDNLRQEVEMEQRHLHAMESEFSAKVSQLEKQLDTEKKRAAEVELALERERSVSGRLQQSLEAAESNQGSREHALVEDLQVQLEAEQSRVQDLRSALQREQREREDMAECVETEKTLLKQNLAQERAINKELKHDLDKVQFERLEAVNKLQKEREMLQRAKQERDEYNDELRQLRSVLTQRNQDRESEKLSDRKAVRNADREKEEYKMKMHENELEVDRLIQKVASLEEQLAESQENELKAIRDQERLRNMQPLNTEPDTVSATTSPRRDVRDMESSAEESVAERNERLQVYRSQLESMCQSLHYLILRCREQLGKATRSVRSSDLGEFDALQQSLSELLSEVKQLQEMEGDFMTHPAGSVNERILRQNEELTNFIVRISEEKTELRNTMSRLEEEVWHYRQLDSKYQDMQRINDTTDKTLLSERADWAKERLSLQLALTSAEREIDMLQSDLRLERERRVAAGITDTRETDKVKIEKLFGKYLRAESFRKMLIYQKKYLLVLLGGFQDTEETTLALLSQMGAVDRHRTAYSRQHGHPLTSFRGAVRAVIAISRMKYLVKKWKRATRVGSEVVSGSVDQTNGYMPQSSSYSPPRHGPSSRVNSAPGSSSSSPSRPSYHTSIPHRLPEPTVYSHQDYDAYSSSSYQSTRPCGNILSTPPQKDYSGTKRYGSPSTGARRKILTSASIPAPSQVRFSPLDDSKNGDVADTDDYIHRLENLQTRLGTLQNGSKLSWKKPWR